VGLAEAGWDPATAGWGRFSVGAVLYLFPTEKQLHDGGSLQVITRLRLFIIFLHATCIDTVCVEFRQTIHGAANTR
jgi:hypothetical protein